MNARSESLSSPNKLGFSPPEKPEMDVEGHIRKRNAALRRKNHNKHDWWMGNVQALDVGEKLRLVPFWEKGVSRSDRLEVIIDPGPSFGAGDHPTTIMALELLEVAVARAKKKVSLPTMLDVGTGTGVLAIAAKALRTGFTVALDTDPASVFTARRNLELNHFTHYDEQQGHAVGLLLGGADSINATFDIVAANLAAPVLLRLCQTLTPLSGWFLILSGIADPMLERVLRGYSSLGCKPIMRLQRGGWNAVLFERAGTRGEMAGFRE